MLNENKQAQAKLDELIASCLALQKLYGRDVSDTPAIIRGFHSLLGRFEAKQVMKAFEIWMQRSQEFPTPADIIGIIKRKGKPPLKESDIISIRKKDGSDRSRTEWDMLQEWEAQQNESFSIFEDNEEKLENINKELRQINYDLKSEIRRLNDLVQGLKSAKGIEPPKPTLASKIDNTIQFMKSQGAPQADIDTFIEDSKYIELQQATS